MQPRSHTKSVRQYSPGAQVSAAPGRHCTQVCVATSHFGVAPPHWPSSTQATHWPFCGLHTAPAGHGCCAVQPAMQASLRQT